LLLSRPQSLGPERVGHLRLHQFDDLPLPLELRRIGRAAPGLHGQNALVVEGLAQPRDFTLSLLELLPQLIYLPFGVAGAPSAPRPGRPRSAGSRRCAQDFLLGGAAA